jgi:Ca2+-binding RTX toxin-like protein
MIKKYNLGPCVLGLLSVLVWGCAAPVAPEDPQGEAGTNGAGPDGRGGSSGNGSGGSGGAGVDPIDMLPGVTDPLDVPPTGCLNAASAALISLSLNAEIPSVLLEATDGVLHANGIACTDSGGAEVPVAGLTTLSVAGDGAAEGAVILDLASGDWSALIDAPEGIAVSFPSGDNSFLVRGSTGNDFIRHGMRGLDLVVDLVGDGRINVVAAGVTQLGASLAAGDDKLDDLSALLAERAAEEAAAAEGSEQTSEGEEEVAPVTALSLRLIASGGEGNDWLLGGSADDEFNGGAGDDVASGLDGDDTVYSAEVDGADTFNGGLGYDYVSYEERGGDLEIAICASPAQIGCVAAECSCDTMSGEAGEEDLILNVEDITAGSGDDIIRGSEAADSLSGGPGADSIYGLGGSDVLYGQGGDDVFDGGADGDYCDALTGEQVSGCEL